MTLFGPVTPVVASDAMDLCTLAQVKERMGLSSTAQDDKIAGLIASCTEVFNNRYHREFMPRSTGTRYFNVSTRYIPIVDLASATTVLLGDVELTEGVNYALVMCDLSGTATHLQIAADVNLSSDHLTRFGTTVLSITGTWGIWSSAEEVALDVNQAATETVLSWVDRGSSTVAGIDNGDARSIAPAAGVTWDIPFSAHKKMQPWAMTPIGVW